MLTLPAGLVRAAFNLLYGPFAPWYDWVSRTFFLDQWRHWQRASLAHVSGVVLEVGAGTGELVCEAAERGWAWVAIEKSAPMIAQAKRKLARAGYGATLAQGLTFHLPIATQSVDCIVSTFPTEYIVDRRTLDEFDRVLKPNGVVVVTPMAVLIPSGPIGRALDALHKAVYGGDPQITGLPGPDGFVWDAQWAPSPHGRAIVLIGRRAAGAAGAAIREPAAAE